MDEISLFAGTTFDVVDVALPEVFAGGIIGASLVMLFSSYTLDAVSVAAQELVDEVRRQFRVSGWRISLRCAVLLLLSEGTAGFCVKLLEWVILGNARHLEVGDVPRLHPMRGNCQ